MTCDSVPRRQFAKLGASAAAAVAFSAGASSRADGQQQPQRGRGGTGSQPQPTRAPDALKSEFLMDLVLETAPPANLGGRTIASVTGGTFEGPKLKGKVLPPGADWLLAANPRLRVLDVRTLLVTDDNQLIYCTYRGIIYTPPAGQGEQYWRNVPIFETNADKYAWLNHIVAVGVSYKVPQRVAYRVFQIL